MANSTLPLFGITGLTKAPRGMMTLRRYLEKSTVRLRTRGQHLVPSVRGTGPRVSDKLFYFDSFVLLLPGGKRRSITTKRLLYIDMFPEADLSGVRLYAKCGLSSCLDPAHQTLSKSTDPEDQERLIIDLDSLIIDPVNTNKAMADAVKRNRRYRPEIVHLQRPSKPAYITPGWARDCKASNLSDSMYALLSLPLHERLDEFGLPKDPPRNRIAKVRACRAGLYDALLEEEEKQSKQRQEERRRQLGAQVEGYEVSTGEPGREPITDREKRIAALRGAPDDAVDIAARQDPTLAATPPREKENMSRLPDRNLPSTGTGSHHVADDSRYEDSLDAFLYETGIKKPK